MRINHNISSIIAKNALAKNDARFSESTLKLSSGYKINKASDNSAGLAIARKMNAQIRGIIRANENANDGISVVNTADGAMMEMHNILQRMNELAIQAANGPNSDDDRAKIQLEIDQLRLEIDRIADTTQFNAQTLLDGTFAYKGYTNTENVRVMTSTDGVTSGTYAIGTISYDHIEKKITKYANSGKTVEEVDLDKAYDLKKADNIRNALVFKKDLATYDPTGSMGLRAFPSDSLVSIEDEYIVIKSKGDFEVKLAINNNNPNIGSDAAFATTATTSTAYRDSTYNQIIATSDDGKTCSISGIKIREELADDGSTISTQVKEDYGAITASLKEFFEAEGQSGVQITNVSILDSGKKIEISCNSDQGGRKFAFDIDRGGTLSDYLYKTEEFICTTYTVGGSTEDDFIAINISGMGPMRVQVGANEGQFIEMEIPDLNTLYLGVDKLSVRTEESATEAINTIGKAINYLSGVRAKIGAYTNRLEQTVKNLETTEENMTASYSRIMDVDMAKEMTEYTTVQVLVQASTSMLAQANQRPQQVLQLLQ